MATIKELEDFKLSDAVKFNDELNPLLWEDEKLRSEIRKQLLKIADNFAEYLGLEDLKIEDITISGSNAAYTWTQHSDIDLHLLVDFSNLPHNSVYQELFTAKKTIYNDTHDITVKGLPVELYVQDTNETHHSMGTYSIKNDEWISIPKKEKPNFDEAATKLKYEKLGDMIELALKTKDLEKVKKVLSLIKRYRKAGLDKNGEFGPENISFKAVRKQGLVQKLFDLKAELQSKELSINEYAQNSEPINPKKEFPITVYIYSVIHNKTIRLMGERLGKLTPSGNIKTQFVLPNSGRKIVEWIPVVDKKYPTGQLSDNVHVRSSQKPNKVASDGAFEFWAYLPKLEEGNEYKNSGLRYYKNPTSKQLFNLVKKSKHNHMRGMYLPGTGRTFWWDAGDAIHKAAAEELGLEYSYLNRMEAAIDSVSNNYYVSGDDGVPNEVIQKYDIEDDLLYEAPYQIDEIGFADALDNLSLPEHEIIDNSTATNTIGQKPVHIFKRRSSTLYFFATATNILALVLLDGNNLKAIKNFTTEKGMIYSLLNYIVSMEGLHINIAPSEPFTQEGFEWLLRLATNTHGLKLTTSDGNIVDTETLKREWNNSRLTKEPGETGLVISESSAGWKQRLIENENSLMPFRIFEYSEQLVEASGYIPSKKEKNDSRFKTALTVDVTPNSIRKNAKAFNWKTSRAGVPPELKTNGKISEQKQVFRDIITSYKKNSLTVNEVINKLIQIDLPYTYIAEVTDKLFSNKNTTFNDKVILESKDEKLYSQLVTIVKSYSVTTPVLEEKYIPVMFVLINDRLQFFDVEARSPAIATARFGLLKEIGDKNIKMDIDGNIKTFPDNVISEVSYFSVILVDSREKYEQLRTLVSLKFGKELPPFKKDDITESLINDWKMFNQSEDFNSEALITYTPIKKFITEQEEILYVCNNIQDPVEKLWALESIASRTVNENQDYSIKDAVKSLSSFSSKLVIGNKYIPVQFNALKNVVMIYDVKNNLPATEPAQFGELIKFDGTQVYLKIDDQIYRYPKDLESPNAMNLTIFLDSTERYEELRTLVSLKFDQELPAFNRDSLTENMLKEWNVFLNEEQQELFPGYDKQHRQERLSAWFKHSQAIANGRPKVLYHATTKHYDQFRAKNMGFASALGIPVEIERHGIFLAETPEFAEEYITDYSRGKGYKQNAVVIPVYLSAQKTFDLRDDAINQMLWDDDLVEEFANNDISLRDIYNYIYEDQRWELFDGEEGGQFVENLKKMGYDSAFMYESGEQSSNNPVWVAFSPSQVKSATGNRGSYSSDDPRMIKEDD